MKKVLLLITFLSFVIVPSFAQINSEKLVYLQKVEKYRRMKSTGATLTIGGSVLMVTGLIVLSNSSYEYVDYGNGNTQERTTGNPLAGAVIWIVGNASVGAGIPIWIIGKNNFRKYSNKLESVSIKVNTNPQYSGLTLACKF